MSLANIFVVVLFSLVGLAAFRCSQRSEIDPGQRLETDPPWRV